MPNDRRLRISLGAVILTCSFALGACYDAESGAERIRDVAPTADVSDLRRAMGEK